MLTVNRVYWVKSDSYSKVSSFQWQLYQTGRWEQIQNRFKMLNIFPKINSMKLFGIKFPESDILQWKSAISKMFKKSTSDRTRMREWLVDFSLCYIITTRKRTCLGLETERDVELTSAFISWVVSTTYFDWIAIQGMDEVGRSNERCPLTSNFDAKKFTKRSWARFWLQYFSPS